MVSSHSHLIFFFLFNRLTQILIRKSEQQQINLVWPYGAYNNVYYMTYTALAAIICWSKNIGDAHKPVEEEISNQQS